MKKRIFYGLSIVGFIVLLAFLVPMMSLNGSNQAKIVSMENNSTNTILKQKVIGLKDKSSEIYDIYYDNQKIGTLVDKEKLNQMLERVYKEKYEILYPNSSAQLTEDIIVSAELNYWEYENIDDQIVDFIESLDLFAFEATKVTFSNGNVAFVEDIDVFNTARDRYMLNFIDASSLARLKTSQYEVKIPEGSFQSNYVSAKIEETIKVSKAYGPADKILKTEDEILFYLTYGYSTTPEYYSVNEGDTVQGIAFKHKLYPQQLIMINPELKSMNQILQTGMKLNVTYYNSPITVKVEKNTRDKVVVYRGEAERVFDENMYEDEAPVIVDPGSDGFDDVLYHETYINGELMSGEELSRKTISLPKNPVIRVGAKLNPGVGTKSFRYPVDNVAITCVPGCACYCGHNGLDVIDTYNRYGPIYAADSGVIEAISFSGTNGYYVIINHNNGTSSYYGHMLQFSPLTVGTKVKKGDFIGNIGATGLTSGPHVHFEIREGSGNFFGQTPVVCNYVSCFGE